MEPHTPAWEDIVRWFGAEVILSDGALNRVKLASIVFSDENQRKKLESFIHPRILERQQYILQDIEQRDPSAIVIVDVPLLFEVGMDRLFSHTILAYAPADIQIERLRNRDGFTTEEAQRRIDAQTPIEEKVSKAHFVIHNEGEINTTEKQVKSIFSELKKLEKQNIA